MSNSASTFLFDTNVGHTDIVSGNDDIKFRQFFKIFLPGGSVEQVNAQQTFRASACYRALWASTITVDQADRWRMLADPTYLFLISFSQWNTSDAGATINVDSLLSNSSSSVTGGDERVIILY